MTPQGAPDPKQTMDFLQQGGSFALLCILIIGGAIGLAFAGRALFRLLREYLGASNAQLVAQTKILADIHTDQAAARANAAKTAAAVEQWGSPEWLRGRLDKLDRDVAEIKAAISAARLELAHRHSIPTPGGATV